MDLDQPEDATMVREARPEFIARVVSGDTSSAKEAAAGLDAVREIQGERSQTALNEASCRSERRLVSDLDLCCRERDPLVTWQRSVWGNAQLGGTSSLHSVAPNDLLPGLGDIATCAGGFDCGSTECSGSISGDVQLLPSRCGHLLGIEAWQHIQRAHDSHL
jgi:hypothetical protein